MKSRYFALALTILCACGGDPLVASWVNTSDPDGANASATYTDTLTFKADKTITDNIVIVYSASDTTPDCTFTQNASGSWTETTANTTATLNFTTGNEQTLGCTNATDTHAQAPLTSAELASVNGAFTYSFSGNTLTLAPAATGSGVTTTYTKK